MRKYPARHRAVIDAIRTVRKREGVSQRELSNRLKEVTNFVHTIEQDRRGVLVEEFIEIAELLEVDPRELFDLVLNLERKRAGRK